MVVTLQWNILLLMSLVMSLATQASVNMYPKTTSCYNKVGQTTWFKIFSEKQTGEGLHISPHQLGCCTVIHRYSVYSVSSYDRSLSTKNWFLRPVAPLQHPTRVSKLRDSTAVGKKKQIPCRSGNSRKMAAANTRVCTESGLISGWWINLKQQR